MLARHRQSCAVARHQSPAYRTKLTRVAEGILATHASVPRHPKSPASNPRCPPAASQPVPPLPGKTHLHPKGAWSDPLHYSIRWTHAPGSGERKGFRLGLGGGAALDGRTAPRSCGIAFLHRHYPQGAGRGSNASTPPRSFLRLRVLGQVWAPPGRREGPCSCPRPPSSPLGHVPPLRKSADWAGGGGPGCVLQGTGGRFFFSLPKCVKSRTCGLSHFEVVFEPFCSILTHSRREMAQDKSSIWPTSVCEKIGKIWVENRVVCCSALRILHPLPDRRPFSPVEPGERHSRPASPESRSTQWADPYQNGRGLRNPREYRRCSWAECRGVAGMAGVARRGG